MSETLEYKEGETWADEDGVLCVVIETDPVVFLSFGSGRLPLDMLTGRDMPVKLMFDRRGFFKGDPGETAYVRCDTGEPVPLAEVDRHL
jgi:hypothetical protein